MIFMSIYKRVSFESAYSRKTVDIKILSYETKKIIDEFLQVQLRKFIETEIKNAEDAEINIYGAITETKKEEIRRFLETSCCITEIKKITEREAINPILMRERKKRKTC